MLTHEGGVKAQPAQPVKVCSHMLVSNYYDVLNVQANKCTRIIMNEEVKKRRMLKVKLNQGWQS